MPAPNESPRSDPRVPSRSALENHARGSDPRQDPRNKPAVSVTAVMTASTLRSISTGRVVIWAIPSGAAASSPSRAMCAIAVAAVPAAAASNRVSTRDSRRVSNFRPHGRPKPQLALAPERLCERKARDVHAGDQKQHGDGTEQHEQRLPCRGSKLRGALLIDPRDTRCC